MEMVVVMTIRGGSLFGRDLPTLKVSDIIFSLTYMSLMDISLDSLLQNPNLATRRTYRCGLNLKVGVSIKVAVILYLKPEPIVQIFFQ